MECDTVRMNQENERVTEGRTTMARIHRRKLLQLSGAGALTAKTGGIAGILAASRAPAHAQGTTVHWLRWNDFVPASDELLKKEIAPAADKALGIKVNIETINGNDLQARTTSAIQSGTGPDVILGLNNWPQLYAESLANVDDIVEEIGKAQGGFYEESRAVANDGKRWLGVPWCVLGAMIVYRKSWLAEAGANAFPATWEEYRAVGKKLKAAGRPVGQTLGHTFGDAPTFTYPYLWSWGGKEVLKDGNTVVLNSKETVESVKFMTAFWKEAHDEGGLAWDDTNNNRAFLSSTISATLNGASIYLLAKGKPDTYLDEKGKPMFQDMAHSPLPKGPAGQFGYHLPMTNMLMGYSKNQKAAKDFLRWMTSKEVYQKWFNSQQGYSVGSTTIWEKDALWDKDPVMLPFRAAARAGRFPGYEGPADRKAAEGLSKYLVTDMYAKAAQGMAAEEAVKWADGEFRRIHGT
jgi:multiple sugar transport system substrate-binding protein